MLQSPLLPLCLFYWLSACPHLHLHLHPHLCLSQDPICLIYLLSSHAPLCLQLHPHLHLSQHPICLYQNLFCTGKKTQKLRAYCANCEHIVSMIVSTLQELVAHCEHILTHFWAAVHPLPLVEPMEFPSAELIWLSVWPKEPLFQPSSHSTYVAIHSATFPFSAPLFPFVFGS